MKETKSIADKAGPAGPGVFYIHVIGKLATFLCYIW